MAEFSSSSEARALARLKVLHRADEAPPQVRALVAERLARLEAPAPRSGFARRGGLGLLLLAAAAAVVLGVRSEHTQVTLSPEQPAPEQPAAEQPAPEQPASEQPAAEQPALVSLSGAAVPGSLRWRAGGAEDESEGERLQCQYLFLIEPEGRAPVRVRWTRCEFPRELREITQRRSSPVSGPLRVFVAGRWSAPDQLEATELRVRSLGAEP